MTAIKQILERPRTPVAPHMNDSELMRTARLRERAEQCRWFARQAQSRRIAAELESLARDCDSEAARLEAFEWDCRSAAMQQIGGSV
jgi:hypothetical protein